VYLVLKVRWVTLVQKVLLVQLVLPVLPVQEVHQEQHIIIKNMSKDIKETRALRV
jgi:hypothetical protein